MVTAIINRFIDKLRKEPSQKVESLDPKTPDSGPLNNGVNTAKIDLVAFVDFVARSLVDHPEEVKIETEQKENGLVMRVSCNKEEVRKIIGKNGKTINAIRALAKGAAKRLKQNITIIVID